MWKILKSRGVDLAIVVVALTALMPEPAWAFNSKVIPGPAAGGLAAAAIFLAFFVRLRRNCPCLGTMSAPTAGYAHLKPY